MIKASMPLQIPDFEMRKSTNISQILFSSDLLPQEISNVNITSANFTKAAMWFNVDRFLKFIVRFLPFTSKKSVIRSTGKMFEMQVYIDTDDELLEDTLTAIAEFYEDMTKLIEAGSHSEVRITNSVIEFHSQHCGTFIQFNQEDCDQCGTEVATCVICYQPIDDQSGVLSCCASYIHRDHLDLLTRSCPYCKVMSYEIISLQG